MPCYESLMPWELLGELQSSVLSNNVKAVRELVDRLNDTYLDHLDANGRTPLLNACRLGYLEIAAVLMGKDGVDINCADDSGDTPLSSACLNGHHDIVHSLCLQGADPTLCGGNGCTPYHRALQAGQVHAAEVVRVFELQWRGGLVVQAEQKKRALTVSGEGAKRQAIRKQFSEELRITNRIISAREMEELMPDDDSDDGSVVRFSRQEVARIAVARPDVAKWSSAVSSEAPPPQPQAHAQQHPLPLRYEEAGVGCEGEEEEGAQLPASPSLTSTSGPSCGGSVSHELLLDVACPAASPGGAPPQSCTAFEHGSQAPPPSPVMQAFEAPQQRTPQAAPLPPRHNHHHHHHQHRHTPASSPAVVSAAARSPAESAPPTPPSQARPLERAHSQGAYEILCAAAHRGELQTCQRLAGRVQLERPGDASSHTPLVWAVVGGQVAVVAWLLGEGVDASHRDSCGYTAMFHAVQHGKDEVVRLLARHNRALLHDTDYEGHNTVQWAAFSGSTSTLRLLVEGYNVGLDVLDNDGKSALHWAAQQGNAEAVQYILPRCDVALPFQRDANGMTAEDQARVGAHLKTANSIRTHCLALSQPIRNM